MFYLKKISKKLVLRFNVIFFSEHYADNVLKKVWRYKETAHDVIEFL